MLQFQYTATMEDLMVVTRAGMARISGSGADGAMVGAGSSDAAAVFRRLGWLLLLVGAAASGVWIANLVGWIRMPSLLRFFVSAIGIGAISIGWALVRIRLDMGTMLADGQASGSLLNDEKLQRAIADIGEVQVAIDSQGVRMKSRNDELNCRWSELSRVWRDGDYIVMEGTGLAGAIIVLPPRALPAGTNQEAMMAVLGALHRGEVVAGLD